MPVPTSTETLQSYSSSKKENDKSCHSTNVKNDEGKVKGGQETELMKRGRRRIVWEVAVGCLGLAVKVTYASVDNKTTG